MRFKHKICDECSDAFTPVSGRQRRCDPCRYPDTEFTPRTCSVCRRGFRPVGVDTRRCTTCRPTERVSERSHNPADGEAMCVDCRCVFVPVPGRKKTRCPQCVVASDSRSVQCGWKHCLEWFVPDPRNPHTCGSKEITHVERERKAVVDAMPWPVGAKLINVS